MTDQEILIELKNINKFFDLGSGRFVALNDVTTDFYSGEFTSIVGRSGSGKTTLMNMITGIDKPSSGEVLVGGQPIHQFTESKMAKWRGENLGIVFQFYQLIPVLTLLENVMLPMEMRDILDPNACEQRAMQLLSEVGLSTHIHQRPYQVSGGQQQSAAIARALANDPPILIADEPTGNLGSIEAERILSIFSSLVSHGKTILMVTHDTELASHAHRVLQLSDGQLVGERIPDQAPSNKRRWFQFGRSRK